MLRALAFRALAGLLGACVAVLACEVLLRMGGYAGDRDRARRSFSSKYGAVPRDSWIFDFAIDPKRHRAVELRGQLLPLRKPAGELRVLFLGDSATEGAFVRPERAFPARFAALAEARLGTVARPRYAPAKTSVRAINAGVWGMTTIDEYHLLHDKLLPLAPDVVVLGLFMANDINFNLGHGRRRLRYQAPAWVDAMREHSALAHLLFLRALVLNQRHRFVRADQLGSAWIDERIGLVDERGLHMLSYPAGELALYLRKPTKLVDEAFGVLHDTLAALRALGEQRGFGLRVLLIPTPSSVLGRLAILAHPGFLVELRQQGIHIEDSELDFALPIRRVLALCAQLEITCTDATPDFKRLGPRAFFVHDEHPTSAGHEALAQALLQTLLQTLP